MTRTLLRSVVAVSLVVAWATTTEACHKRRARVAVACVGTPQGYASYAPAASAQSGYTDSTAGYAAPASYPGGAYGGYPAGAYGGYDFGRPGYNPGGLGGPASGLGVRPGMGLGGFGPGR